MDLPDEKTADHQAQRADTPRRRHRWWQFGLRGLLLLVIVIAVGLLACRQYLKPYWRQQQTIVLIEKLGGTCQTAEAGPWCLRLAGSTHNVTQVNLADCDDPDAYLADVAELPAIELLIVGGPAFTDEHARRLHNLPSLRGLILDCTSVSEEGLAALHRGARDTEVFVSQRRAIAVLGKLGSLGLGLDESPLRQLAGSEWFEHAGAFLSRDDFSDSDAVQLRILSQLRTLVLDGSPISDAGLEHIGKLTEIRLLMLRYTRLSDAGLENLKELQKLNRLSLDDTNVTDAGLEHLQRMIELKDLSLERTQITDAGLAQLKKMGQLEYIDLQGTRCTAAGVAKLKEALPKCVISRP